MFLQLGTYKFEGIKLPQAFGGTFATAYAQIPIIDGKPVVQKAGEKLNEFDITALFSDEFCTPVDEVEALQLIRRNGVVSQLTGGDGVNYGRYIITDITVTNTRAFSDGYVSQITANIKLLEYNTTATTVKTAGSALISQKPVPQTPVAPLTPLPASIHNDIKSGIDVSKEVESESKKTTINYKYISQLADEAVSSWNQADSKIQNTVKIAARATTLQSSLTSASTTMGNIKTAAEAQDPVALYDANAIMSTNITSVKRSSAPLAAFMGAKEGGY